MDKNLEQETTETILLNHMVVQRIMKNLDTENLLAMGRVNKTWTSEARRVLRDDRKCFVFISRKNPCSRARELNDLLGSFSTTVVPFNGISITIGPHECDVHLRDRKIDEIYGNLMQLPFKFMEFKWNSWGNLEKCPLGQVILRLMASSASLEELKIEEIPMNVGLEPQNAPQEGPPELPKLKILKLPESQLEELLKANLVKILSDRAPHLEELENEFFPEWIGLLSPNKLRIVKNLRIHEYDDQAYGGEFITSPEDFLSNMKRISESEPKLRTLSAYKPYFIDETTPGDMETYVAHLLGTIVSSSDSLREVTLDHFTAAMLQGLTLDFLPVVRNVTTVDFVMFQGENAGIGQCLHGARLAEIFPNVTNIRFYPGSYKFTGENDLVAEANDARFPWSAVVEVDLGDLDLNEQTVTELGAVFPNLRVLTAHVSYETPDYLPLQQIWSSLASLQSLTMGRKLTISPEVNFDAVFCGIHPEEAEILLEKDEEFLKGVNIVPAFPAINHLKGLKSLSMELELKTHSVASMGIDGPLLGKTFLSRTTGLIALRRMPDLVLELTAPYEAAEYLDHLKGFVRLEFRPPNPQAGMNLMDAFFSTGTNLAETVGKDVFARINRCFDQHVDEDDDDLGEFDFSGKF